MRILRTRLFDRRAKEAGLDDVRIENLIARLREHPRLGDVIPGGGGARKIRIAIPGRGTRGGGRVIYAIVMQGSALVLITLYTKQERSDLSPNERKEIGRMISDINQENGND